MHDNELGIKQIGAKTCSILNALQCLENTMPLKRLASQDAIITGAARGIGRACNIRFAQEGANVACPDVAGDADNAVVAECRQLDVDTIALHCNVANPTSVRSAAQATMAHWGRLDVLVAAAGIYSGSPQPDVPPGRWQPLCPPA